MESNAPSIVTAIGASIMGGGILIGFIVFAVGVIFFD